jgi:LPXTG-motif cell wall-anchored protein
MLRAWILILVVAAAVMALPAVALAQSAGDNQYINPLAGGGGNSSKSGGGSGNSGAKGAASSGTAGNSAASTPASGTGSGQGNQLPRTGFPAGLLALSGAALLGSGVALRRRVTPRIDQ